MKEPADDPFGDLHELIRMLLEQSFQGEGPIGYGFKIVIKDGECHMVPLTGTGRMVAEIEPFSEVHTLGETVAINVDLPGVDEEDVELAIEGEKLTISGKGEGRRYRTTLDLPPVDPDTLSFTCRNGVLEVSLLKRREALPGPEYP
ncbi:MAG: Hsp20/alpha crystallin family protein [Methanomicrobiaceae archaeon]|nr:Hsp20/alpha crystallin family protein [Methanomicrobiaceae archaeon]